MTKIYRVVDASGKSHIFALWSTPLGVSVSKFDPISETFKSYALYECLSLRQVKKQLETEVRYS